MQTISEAEFVKEVSKEISMASLNLFREAWDPAPQKGQQKGKSAGPNPFLAPLAAGLRVVGDAAWKQVEQDINDALKRSIY